MHSSILLTQTRPNKLCTVHLHYTYTNTTNRVKFIYTQDDVQQNKSKSVDLNHIPQQVQLIL